MRLVVLGAAESGVGAAILALQKGYEVFVSDMGSIKPRYQEMLRKHHIAFEEGKHTEELILNADEVVKSPGIPDTAPMVARLIEKGTPILSEIEFAARYTDARMIAITGSNGKTTTTSLIYHILKRRAPTWDWLVTSDTAWHCRWPKLRTAPTSSNCRHFSSTICIGSALTSPCC